MATIDALLVDVLLPYLYELGARWEHGEVTVAQEHFATDLLRGRLLGLARGWGRGTGRLALLACPPAERHDLGLIAFGLALRERGWRITYLGSDTPIESIAETARAIQPALLVLAAVAAEPLRELASQLRELSDGSSRVAVAVPARKASTSRRARAERRSRAEAERVSALV